MRRLETNLKESNLRDKGLKDLRLIFGEQGQ